MLLGTVLPTARAAQGAGNMLWFVMLMISGSGPPPEILPRGLEVVGNALPASHVVSLIQDPWLGFGWNVTATVVTLGFLVAGGLATARFLRWD